MAFVNEYVSDRDIAKYPVVEIWTHYHGPGPRLPGFKYSWTVDRERDAFLMAVKTGKEESSNRITFVLWWSGEQFEFELDNFGLGNIEGPVTTTWKLAKMAMPANTQKDKVEIIDTLKDAIATYKIFGIIIPVSDHTAVFEF